MTMRVLGKSLMILVVAASLALLAFLAFARRDHQVELIVTYPQSSPDAIWTLLTDHAAEPEWLAAFGTVTRQSDIGGREVWLHSSPDGAFNFRVMTVSAIPRQRYERILLRDNQPRNQSWDGRWVYELEPAGAGTRLKISEYGWTDGIPFFISQRVLSNPDAFLQFYARAIARQLNDRADIQVVRSY